MGMSETQNVLTKSSKPKSVPVNSRSLFMITQIREPIHLSINSADKRFQWKSLACCGTHQVAKSGMPWLWLELKLNVTTNKPFFLPSIGTRSVYIHYETVGETLSDYCNATNKDRPLQETGCIGGEERWMDNKRYSHSKIDTTAVDQS